MSLALVALQTSHRLQCKGRHCLHQASSGMLTYMTVETDYGHKHDLAVSLIPCQLLGCWLDV